MAKQGKYEVVITANGKVVESVLTNLRKLADDARQKMDDLAASGKENTKEWREAELEWKAYDKAVKQAATDSEKIERVLSDLSGSTTKQLTEALRAAKKQLDSFSSADPRRQKLIDEIEQIKTQIAANRGELGKVTEAAKESKDAADELATSWTDVAKKMGLVALAAKAFDYVKDKIGDVVKGNLQLSDSMAAVKKVTGMASDEVARLTTDLSKLDTRTTLEDLNAIAEAGGRMGLSKYGIQGMEQFVNAANQIQVALGDDLGDSIDESILPLAKLGENLGLFEKMGVEKAMLAIGSAINELGATSTAQGANIVDFSRRIQASAQLARLSTADILALGSAIDAAGITSEVGASSFSKFFASIRTNTTAIEKALNIPKGTIDELYNANRTMEATLLILDKMKERGGMRELGDIFKLLGSQGDRMTSTFAAMAKNVDILREHLRTSHEAFDEQISITNEFNSVQETAQGYLDRANNLWSNAFINPKGVDNVKAMAEQWYNLSKVLTESPVFMTQVKVALQALALAVKTLVVLAPFLVEFFMMKGAVQGVKYLMSLRDAFIVNKIALQGMTEAQLAANKAAKANVYIALAAALVTLGTYIYDYATKANDAEKAQERLNNAVSEGAVEAQREIGHLNNVIKALDNAKLSQEGREKVIADFNQKYGQYINALGIEIKTVDDLRKNYDALAGAIRRAAYERVKDKFKEQELEPLIKASIEAGADLQKGGNAQANAISVHDAEQAVSNFSKAIQTLTAKNLKKFRETYKQELQAIGLDPEKATVDQIKAKSTPADTRKIFNRSVQNGPQSLNEYLMNLIDKGEIKSAADAYKNIIMKEFSEGAKFGAEFDENLNYVVGQRVVNGVKVGTPVTKGTGAVGGEKSSVFNKKLYENVEKFVDAYLAVKKRGDEIDSAFDPYIRVSEPQGDNNIKPNKGSGSGTVDKEALKAAKKAAQEAKKAAQEAKQAMRKEMEDAQKESTGVLSKLEEWYRLQEAAITEARADGKMTEEQATQMIRTLSIIKNESLATARRAITTGDTEAWDELKNNVMPKAMADASDLSQNLLETIQNVPVKVLHDNLAKFNGDAEKVFGLDSRAFFDQINAKAAGNTREAARLRAKMFQQAEKLLEQYEMVRVAQKKMQTDLEGIGLYTETYEEFAQRMQQGITEKQPKQLKNGKTITDEEAYGQMGAKFIGQGTIPYRINIENADEALQWLHDFATNAKGELEDWAQAFPDIEKWVTLLQRKNELQEQGRELTKEELAEMSQIPEKLVEAIPVIRAMFYQLETSANNVAETIKKQVEAMTDRKPIGIDERGEQHTAQINLTSQLYDNKISEARSGGNEDAALQLEEQKKQALIDLEYQYQQELWQIREQMGATVFGQYENELAGYKNMLDKKLITEKQFQQKKGQLQMKLGLNVAQQYNGMMSDMINALQEAEIASVEAKYDAEIQAAQANGQDTTALEEQKEAEIMEIRKKYAGMQFAVKISEIIANTAVAIMQAYAQLGPIGGSIAAAMLTVTGAAQLALAKAEYDKVMGMQAGGSKKSASSANTKTKLASGMLTYDKGNVDKFAGLRKLYDDGETQVYGRRRYLGEDGKVYTATAEPAPKDGLVTHPIATTVQGQPALVAENGPEIVIGRETTKAIMMNEPELIRYLANYQKNGGDYRPYDSGNLRSEELRMKSEEFATADNGQSSMLNGQLLEVMQGVLYYLQHPVRPKIDMYSHGGEDGLYDSMKKATAFMGRYGG